MVAQDVPWHVTSCLRGYDLPSRNGSYGMVTVSCGRYDTSNHSTWLVADMLARTTTMQDRIYCTVIDDTIYFDANDGLVTQTVDRSLGT